MKDRKRDFHSLLLLARCSFFDILLPSVVHLIRLSLVDIRLQHYGSSQRTRLDDG